MIPGLNSVVQLHKESGSSYLLLIRWEMMLKFYQLVNRQAGLGSLVRILT